MRAHQLAILARLIKPVNFLTTSVQCKLHQTWREKDVFPEYQLKLKSQPYTVGYF